MSVFFRTLARSNRSAVTGLYNGGIGVTRNILQSSRVALVASNQQINNDSVLFISSRLCSTVKPRDTKLAFQQGNVQETITRWEQEANLATLNLVTQKTGFDKKKYKDLSVQMNDIITLRTKLLGNKHPETVYSNATLGAIYRVVGKHASAANIIKQCASIIETLLQEHKEGNTDYPRKELIALYASIAEEYGRIHIACKEYEAARRALRQAIAVVEEEVTGAAARDYMVHLVMLHRLLAEVNLELNKHSEARESLMKSNNVIKKTPDDIRLPYFLLNHWHGKATADFRNSLFAAKLHSHLSEWEEAENALDRAWNVAATNKGTNSIECCNAFFEILDYYSELIPSRISVQDFTSLLNKGLVAARSTDSILRKTRGIDKRIVFPYYPMIQRGLRALLKFPESRSVCISLLYECLRVHEKYPSIYPVETEEMFTKVMTLVQLLREERQFTAALDLIRKYRPQFSELKEEKPEYVIPFVETQAQLIISSSYSGKDAIAATGRIPLGQQMKLTDDTREAVDALEYICNFYVKKKNDDGAIRTLHSLAIIQTLQEEYSYAERDAYRCIKLIDPTFTEYKNNIEMSTEKIPVHHIARLCDLLILRGSLLRVQHEGSRAITHFTTALNLLGGRKTVGDNAALRIKNDLSRASDILRCLEYIKDISETTLKELEKQQDTAKIEETLQVIKSCDEQHEKVTHELNRLHARYQKKHAAKVEPQIEQQKE